jgi:glycosyltransferase involved in cell wall biosynthesis
MDIAIISDHACPIRTQGSVDAGGQNIYVAQLAAKLSILGHQVEVFTRREQPDEPLIELIPAGYTLIRVPAGPAQILPKEQLLPFMKEFERFMESYFLQKMKLPDVIHANFFMSGLVAMNLKKNLKIPFTITFHALGKVRRKFQQDKDHFPDMRFSIEDNIVLDADGIIAECPQDFADLLNLYSAAPSKIKIVPCGFDPNEIQKINKIEARKILGLMEDELIILHLGRLVPRKGAENIIRAISLIKHELRKINRPFRLLIVGGENEKPDLNLNPEISRLTNIAFELGVLDYVTFSGKKDRSILKYYYSASDLFVTTPWYEPFGITPLEAMACGLPVIGSDVGGLKFSIQDNFTGFLVPPENPQELKKAILHLLVDEKLRHEMGRNAMKRAYDYFQWDSMVNQIDQIFHHLSIPLMTNYFQEVEHVHR